MGKGFQGNYFEDFSLGQRFACAVPRQLSPALGEAYVALTGERTPAWCDASGLVNPWVTFHAAFGQTVRTISLNAVANLGYAGVRWHGPVWAGSMLRTELEVVGLKENSSRTSGVVWVQNTAWVAEPGGAERVALTWWRWVMVHKRGEAPTRWLEAPVVPTMPASVQVEELLPVREALRSPVETGAAWGWNDYAVGERIDTWDAMAVNPSDHMSFTRLFQNSAKVHFDAHGRDGKPLVYGGFVLSQAYALAFNGMENRLGIAAINAGTHANPTWAGDTLYASAYILEKAELSNAQDLGALRVRLIATRNLSPGLVAEFTPDVEDPKKPGRTKLHNSVVLDLDYWEVVPR
jgi:2-methylfumaryl-CoA hydratase